MVLASASFCSTPTRRQAEQPPGVHRHASVYGGFQKNFLSSVSGSALFARGEQGALFPHGLVSDNHVSDVCVLHVDFGNLDSSGDSALTRGQCVARQWIHVLHQCLVLDELRTFSTSKWTRILRCLSVLSQCFSFQSWSRCAHLEFWNYLYEFHVADRSDDGGLVRWHWPM